MRADEARRTMRRRRRLKALSAVVGVGVLLVVVAFFFLRKVDVVIEEPEAEAEIARAGEGFDHVLTDEGRPILRIKGARNRQDDRGRLLVEAVEIELYESTGEPFAIRADAALYDLENKEATLQGDVRLSSASRGVRLQAERLRLLDKGRRVESDGAVRFVIQGDRPLRGRAGELQALLDEGRYYLRGGVNLRSLPDVEPAFSLTADYVVWAAEQRVARAEGKVRGRWGASSVQSTRLAAHLAPEEDRVEVMTARWDVTARIDRPEDGGSTLDLAGDQVVLELDDAGRHPTRVRVEGDGRKPANLVSRPVAGAVTTVDAGTMEALFTDGVAHQVDATGDVVFVEDLPGAARRLTAERALAHLGADGEVSYVRVQGGVELREADRTVRADRVEGDPARRLEAKGEPVVLESQRGRLRAPQVTVSLPSGTAQAEGGVQALMVGESARAVSDTPLGARDEPVQVTAEGATFQEEPRSFLFRGAVRAWSGDRVIEADQLRGDEDPRRLSAAGDVQTMFFLVPEAGRDGAPEAGAGSEPEQVVVTSELLTYLETGGELVYERQVKVAMGPRQLACDRMVVELAGGGSEVERMVCEGSVVLLVPAEKKRVAAERGEYDLAQEQVVFTGSPVEIDDGKGGRLTGRRAVYSLPTGAVRVTASADEGAASRGETAPEDGARGAGAGS